MLQNEHALSLHLQNKMFQNHVKEPVICDKAYLAIYTQEKKSMLQKVKICTLTILIHPECYTTFII